MANPVDVVRQHIEAINSHDVEAMAEICSADYEHSDNGVQSFRGREQLIAFYRQFWGSFPDPRVDIRLVVSEGSVVVEEGIWTATNTGPLYLPDGGTGPATGRRIVLPYVVVLEVNGGLIATARYYYDNMSFLDQLGLLPTPTA